MGICMSDANKPINQTQVDQSHFSMMKVVGKGGFGKVNAVTHRPTGNLMAMKRMKKCKLVDNKLHVLTAWRERDIMSKLKSPFLVNLEYAFQDAINLFLIMPFMQGGDLRYYLNTKGRMTEADCCFYSAEIVLGLEELHGLHIIYRDIKPDNILLDDEGHIRISDFGLGVILKEEDGWLTAGGAGTPGYQAPEVLQRTKYGVSADIWSLGITIYEFLELCRPFESSDEVLMESGIPFHPTRSQHAKDLIRKMLIKDPASRLGCGPRGLNEIKSHPFFENIDWAALSQKKMKPPFQPDLERANCSADFELADQFFSEEDPVRDAVSVDANLQFARFEFNAALNPANGPVVDINAVKRKKKSVVVTPPRPDAITAAPPPAAAVAVASSPPPPPKCSPAFTTSSTITTSTSSPAAIEANTATTTTPAASTPSSTASPITATTTTAHNSTSSTSPTTINVATTSNGATT